MTVWILLVHLASGPTMPLYYPDEQTCQHDAKLMLEDKVHTIEAYCVRSNRK